VDDKDRESDIDLPIIPGREGEGIRVAPVRFDPGQQTLRLQFFRQNAEHLLLDVHGEHHTGIADPLCEFPGKEARPAAEIKDPVAGFHVPFRELLRAVEKSPQPGIQMCGPFCGKNAVVGISAMGWRAGRYLAMSHTGNIGKKDANSYGNTRAQKKDDEYSDEEAVEPVKKMKPRTCR